MLEIKVSNQKVDLPVDIQVSLTIENPFTQEGRIPIPYSLSFDLPATVNNLTIFKHVNRINTVRENAELPCDIYFQSIRIATGIMTFAEFNKTIKASFKGVEINTVLKENAFKAQMDTYTFDGRLSERPDFDNSQSYAYKYKQLAIAASQGNNARFVLAPVKLKTDIDKPILFSKKIETPEGSYTEYNFPDHLMDSEYLNFYNPKDKNLELKHTFGDYPPEYNKAAHTSYFPFLRVNYFLDQVLGDRLVHNIFEEGDLKDLVILNTYFENHKDRGDLFFTDLQAGMMFNNNPPFTTENIPFFNLADFLPGQIVSDIVKDLLRLFCCVLQVQNGKFEIRYNKNILKSAIANNWSSKLIGDLIIFSQEKKEYKYGYSETESYTAPEGVTVVDGVNQMIARYPATAPDSTVFHILSTGQYFKKDVVLADDSANPATGKRYVTYENLSTGYGVPKETKTNSFDSVSKISPLPTSIEEYWWDRTMFPNPPETAMWEVPLWDGDRNKRPTETNIMFHRGLVGATKPLHTYPFLTAYNKGPNGETLGETSLAWEGLDGLYNKFHKEFAQWTEKEKTRVSGTFLLNNLDLKSLDITEKVHLKGRNFFIEKIQVTIRHNRIDPAVVDFIEA